MSSKKVCVKKSIILALEKLREVLVVSTNQDGEKAKPKRALIKIMINNSVQKPTRKLRPLHTYATNKLFLFTEINAFELSPKSMVFRYNLRIFYHEKSSI